MNTLLRSLACTAAVALVTVTASAQIFVGSDNFNSGSDAAWAYAFRFPGSAGNGELTFTNQRLDFVKASPGAGSYVLGWDGDGAGTASRTLQSFSTSWVADITVTNQLTGVAPGEFTTIGFEIGGSGAQYSAIMLGVNNTGSFLRAEGSGFSPVEMATVDTTDVQLRMNWDAASQQLSTFYRFDSGAYTSLATISPVSNWTAGAASGGFYFEVFGNSSVLPAFGAGMVSADNFSVAAIPEPSTYAAMAGAAALGLAFWRRRRAQANAQA